MGEESEHPPGDELPPLEVLGPRIALSHRVASSHWPKLAVPLQTFTDYLAVRLRPGLAAFEHAADLFLACAVVHRIDGAARAFEQSYGTDIERGLARIAAPLEDPGQHVRIRLLVGDEDRPPKLASYAGLGPLRHWLRLTVVRMRTDLLRAHGRVERPQAYDPAALANEIAARGDPESFIAREDGVAIFEETIAAALLRLSVRDRVLLRQNVVEGLSAKQLAVAYGVHHATAKRWLVRAREALWTEARALLESRHRLTSRTIDSIARQARSRIEARLPDLLRSRAPSLE